MNPRGLALRPSGFVPPLAELKARVRTAQVKAARSVNRELILLDGHRGPELLRAQKTEGWGTKAVERLAADLSDEFSELDGFSVRNLQRMRTFADAYSSGESGPQPGAQFDSPPEPLALLPWGSNILLREKLKDPATRLWSARKTLEHGWSGAVLTVQRESRLHQRSGKAITNFTRTLPPAQSDLARKVLKDPYTFGFLALGEAAHERDLERGLVEHVQQHHLRLRGCVLVDLKMKSDSSLFSVGSLRRLAAPKGLKVESPGQRPGKYSRKNPSPERAKPPVRLALSGLKIFFIPIPRGLPWAFEYRPFGASDRRAIDPLENARNLKSFEPEFAGKMNFYLSAIDDQLRHRHDAPTIGLLLCKDAKNKLTVEDALRDVKKPSGVAEWQTRLEHSLPKKRQGTLPTNADSERELNKPRRQRAKATT